MMEFNALIIVHVHCKFTYILSLWYHVFLEHITITDTQSSLALHMMLHVSFVDDMSPSHMLLPGAYRLIIIPPHACCYPLVTSMYRNHVYSFVIALTSSVRYFALVFIMEDNAEPNVEMGKESVYIVIPRRIHFHEPRATFRVRLPI